MAASVAASRRGDSKNTSVAGTAAQLLEPGLAPACLGRQEAGKQEGVGGQAGRGQRGEHGRSAGDRHDPDAGRQRLPDQPVTRVGDQRRAGVGDQRDDLPSASAAISRGPASAALCS